MGLAQRRQEKRRGKFVVELSTKGGSFETSCTAAQIQGWLKSNGKCRVADESENSISVNPVFGDGKVGTEIITVKTFPASSRTRVVVELALNAKPGMLNLNALGLVSSLMKSVSEADPAWMSG